MDEAKQLLARRRSLIDQRSQVNFEIAEIDRRLSDLCSHEWKWHQIAGEGRYCTKCGATDYCDD